MPGLPNLLNPWNAAAVALACALSYGLWDQGYRAGYRAAVLDRPAPPPAVVCGECMSQPAKPMIPAAPPVPMSGGRRY